MIEALANRNPKPKLIRSEGLGRFELDMIVPLFDKKYDWKEHERVQAATEAIATDESPEMWEGLVAHQDDRRYWLTLADEAGAAEFGAADSYTVGDFCTELAAGQLFAPVAENLYILQSPPTSDVKPQHRAIDPPFGNDLRKWRKSHPRKTFYELQIEVCKQAIDNLPGLTGPSAPDKAKFRKQMESEIEHLRRSKTGHFRGDGSLHGFSGERYNEFGAERAMEIRKAYEEAKKAGELKEFDVAEQKVIVVRYCATSSGTYDRSCRPVQELYGEINLAWPKNGGPTCSGHIPWQSRIVAHFGDDDHDSAEHWFVPRFRDGVVVPRRV